MPTKSNKQSGRRLYRNLNGIPKALEARAIQRILRIAGEPLESEMKLLVRKKSGDLARSIEIRTEKKSKDRYLLKVGPLGEHGWRAHFLEFGTKRMTHGPYPFIRPAWDSRRDQTLRMVGNGVGKIIRGAIK